MKTSDVSKKTTIKSILNSAAFLPLVFFITSVSLWGAFISKVYYEDRSNQIIESLNENVVIVEPLITTNDKQTLSLNSKRIEALTKELDEQQQKNVLLKIQIEEEQSRFRVLIDQSVAAASASDREYLDVLSGKSNGLNEEKNNVADITETDYFNRVEVANDSQKISELQQKFNRLLPSPDATYAGYVKAINLESNIRKNEVRSIVLKRGESIWMIAKRAYGDGFQYRKILAANPQISESNAKQLKPGTIIRVPI